jgi:hypothetical protein
MYDNWRGRFEGSVNKALPAGNFAAEVELFYSEFIRQFVENKSFKYGAEVALPKAVGEASRGSL